MKEWVRFYSSKATGSAQKNTASTPPEMFTFEGFMTMLYLWKTELWEEPALLIFCVEASHQMRVMLTCREQNHHLPEQLLTVFPFCISAYDKTHGKKVETVRTGSCVLSVICYSSCCFISVQFSSLYSKASYAVFCVPWIAGVLSF